MNPTTKTTQPTTAADADVRRHLTLNKGDREFRFAYDAGDERQVLEAVAELAGDASEPLDWFDAAVLTHQLGEHLGAELDALLGGKKAA